jgi:hypothetical protein
MYENILGTDRGYKALVGYREKNNELLVHSQKDLELLTGVVGSLNKYKNK